MIFCIFFFDFFKHGYISLFQFEQKESKINPFKIIVQLFWDCYRFIFSWYFCHHFKRTVYTQWLWAVFVRIELRRKKQLRAVVCTNSIDQMFMKVWNNKNFTHQCLLLQCKLQTCFRAASSKKRKWKRKWKLIEIDVDWINEKFEATMNDWILFVQNRMDRTKTEIIRKSIKRIEMKP